MRTRQRFATTRLVFTLTVACATLVVSSAGDAASQLKPGEPWWHLTEPLEREHRDEPAQLAQTDPEGSTDPAVGDIVESLQAFYDGVENYHADFRQTYTNLALGQDQVSTGHVFFKKPGRMRWDYAAPDEKYLISDGETLWIYEPEFQQVARVDLSSSELPTAIRFLMGEGNLAEDFEVSRIECHQPTAHCLRLVPRVSQGHYRSLTFVVDAEQYSVIETTIIDPVGNTNHFEFTNAITSDDLPEAGFTFTPTDEMRVITP